MDRNTNRLPFVVSLLAVLFFSYFQIEKNYRIIICFRVLQVSFTFIPIPKEGGCEPMRISLGFIKVAHLTTHYMDVTSLLESFLRKMVVQRLFVHTGSVIWGDFVYSAR